MNVVQSSARLFLRYSRPRIRSRPVTGETASTFNYASFAPRPQGVRSQQRQERQPQPFVRPARGEYRQDRRREVLEKPREIATTWKGCGLPPRLVERLSTVLPLAEEPTPAQAEFLSAVLLGKRDVFLKEDTGRGKTLALVLAALAHHLRPRRIKHKTKPAGPTFLLLVPSTTLLAQVERWFNEIYPDEKGDVWGTIYPEGAATGSGGQLPEGGDKVPDILISTPSALWDRLDNPKPGDWLTTKGLKDGLQVMAMDEPDAIIRPLPGRYEQQGGPGKRHVFHRHPPVGVKLLEAILPARSDEERGRRVQTVWTSATVNSLLRGYIVKRGWARPRGEGGVVLEHSGAVKGNDEKGVEHMCWVIDPETGKHTDLAEPVTPGSAEGSDLKTDMQQVGSGEVHPYLLEALALYWASGTRSGKSLVIPPNGTSVRKLQETLSDLGCPSVSLDVDSRETAREVGEALKQDESLIEADEADGNPEAESTNDKDTLYILPRSHLRGIDVPNVKTVYLLGGLGVKDLKGGGTGAGVWAEREREYLHWAGRMGRMQGTAGNGDEGVEGKDVLMTFVLKGPEEELMRKFMEKMEERRRDTVGDNDNRL